MCLRCWARQARGHLKSRRIGGAERWCGVREVVRRVLAPLFGGRVLPGALPGMPGSSTAADLSDSP
eukprot:2928133-Alexandrium_andersonii.AAC.1